MIPRLPKFVIAIVLLFVSASVSTFSVAQQAPGQNAISADYQKTVAMIPMRDGTKLHTTIYSPRDTSQKYPFMINRTPYSIQPYGADRYPFQVGPSRYTEAEKYIFVHQDVRGRWMSEGNYDNMRPHVQGDSAIDESSDTYDTIEWLLKNVEQQRQGRHVGNFVSRFLFRGGAAGTSSRAGRRLPAGPDLRFLF